MASDTQYVTLGIGKEVFAVPVVRVQEILELRPIARLPYAPQFLLGMIDVRNQSVPVIDLRAKLGLEPALDTHDTRIIVLRADIGQREIILGLKTDRVFEVTSLDGDSLEPAPDIGLSWRSEAIEGVGRRNGAFVTVLDLTKMFSQSDIAHNATVHSGEAAA